MSDLASVKQLLKTTTPKNGVKKSKAPQGGVTMFGSHDVLELPSEPYDYITERILLGDGSLAEDLERLSSEGITHVLNVSQGAKFNQINTSEDFYKDSGIDFLGINATDTPKFKLAGHFGETGDFIQRALNSKDGKIYIHCHQGISRSATILAAYFVATQGMSLADSLVRIREKRAVFPNDGFLKQLIELDAKLHRVT